MHTDFKRQDGSTVNRVPHNSDLLNPIITSAIYDPTVSVVIPTLNEEKNLPHVLPRIPTWVYEIVIVDGHSKDRTIAVAREFCPGARIIMQKGRGKGDALKTGFEAATGDIIVTFDADGSTDPQEIHSFVGALMSGADFVKGSRFLQGGGTADMEIYRRWGNKVLTLLVRLGFGGNYSDLCYGYNAFWRYALPILNLDVAGFEVETLMNIRVLKENIRVAEVPSFEAKRIHGTSNLRTIPDGWRILRTIIREKHAPTKRQEDWNRDINDINSAARLLPDTSIHQQQSKSTSLD